MDTTEDATQVAEFEARIARGESIEPKDWMPERYRKQLTGRGYRPEAEIVAARLGNEAGLIGAADLAREAVRGGEDSSVGSEDADPDPIR